MQGLHRLVDAPFENQRHYRQRIAVGRLDRVEVRRRRFMQHVVNHLAGITGMTDADANMKTPKIAGSTPSPSPVPTVARI